MTYRFKKGNSPLLISIPHDGKKIPSDIEARLTDKAKAIPDPDWPTERLYEFVNNRDVSMLIADYSRYVIDLNRNPEGDVLYPNQFNTGLCPTVNFEGEHLYSEGKKLSKKEIAQRVEKYWKPYHDKIQEELQRLKKEHGYAILFDAHSIKSQVPKLFDGNLPDLNIGTADGKTLPKDLEEKIENILSQQVEFTYVMNGRFKGGFITRNYGDADDYTYSVQLEIAQKTYMDEESFDYDEAKAQNLQVVLMELITTLSNYKLKY